MSMTRATVGLLSDHSRHDAISQSRATVMAVADIRHLLHKQSYDSQEHDQYICLEAAFRMLSTSTMLVSLESYGEAHPDPLVEICMAALSKQLERVNCL